MSIKVYVRHSPEWLGTQIIVTKLDETSRKMYLAEPVNLVFKEIKESEMVQEPTLSFNRWEGSEFLSGLANALAEAGYRPDELASSNAEKEALKYHLEDMRKLVFGKEQ